MKAEAQLLHPAFPNGARTGSQLGSSVHVMIQTCTPMQGKALSPNIAPPALLPSLQSLGTQLGRESHLIASSSKSLDLSPPLLPKGSKTMH